MSRILTMFFPDGETEYWLTAVVFKPGEKVDRNGKTWIVTSVGETNGDAKHTTVTLSRDGNESRSRDGITPNPS